MARLTPAFFDQAPCELARALLGKVIRHRYHDQGRDHWLACRIIETEAYYLAERGSHSSQGYTPKRAAMFMPPGTIYMYYARGGDSLNISARGKGNAVLIKSAVVHFDRTSPRDNLKLMQRLNPVKSSGKLRLEAKLCSGQTLLCAALGLKVDRWDQQQFDTQHFYLDDVGYRPGTIIQTTRLGIPAGRDEHLMYRYIDYAHAAQCTSNPLRKRNQQEDRDYVLHPLSATG
ncbi:DNA-3-methyladenine glycosylase [Thiohalophilus thiocyanatoxydans]|uniref:Putative 3-methyladenine DNA glycosylase n=1 Tax=Thiohalophilus thiocyanatoxydans TaxID=381308 RepID=A0A4R8J210_9GAMM|nr:DNA-3-methyladenine glycosylase [Thiohalophilus thiocyanatoxydans]TDY03893.1 DNA-3-methyladenine glycosylase [Thiohalophilus thiocyanatoxydans]